jgi:protein-S-isoprenylcysteine O-methyltransferase Ste14
MLFIAVGLVLATVAWSVRDFWYGVAGALSMAVGLWLIWTQRRANRISEACSDAHGESMAWRLGRRRDEDADADIDAGLPDDAD